MSTLFESAEAYRRYLGLWPIGGESLNKAGASDKDGFKASQSSAGSRNTMETDAATSKGGQTA